MSTGPPPNYYAILEVSETATAQQIRDAYKRAALKTHPDRVPATSPERASRTRKFQLVNDAYYTLSDPSRRREFDAQRKLFSNGHRRPQQQQQSYPADPFAEAEEGVPPGAGGPQSGFYSWAWNYFTGANGGGGGTNNAEQRQRARQEAENAQFGDVFEEMLREEGMDGADGRQAKGGGGASFWSLAGGAAGGVLGFIAANFPGAVAGAVAGNRFGAIRDAKGKSVYAVFQELPQDDRARLLAQLATRVFSHAVGI